MPKRLDPDVSRVSSRLVGEVIGRSRVKVHDWVRRGILPNSVGGGKYDLRECVQALVKYYKKQSNDDVEFDARQAVLREKHLALQLENKMRRGMVVEVDEVEEVFMRACALIAIRLEALPGRMAAELAGMSDPAMIRVRLRHEISDIRKNAQAGLEAFISSAKGSGPTQTPTTRSARRVGRSKSRPTRRVARAGPLA